MSANKKLTYDTMTLEMEEGVAKIVLNRPDAVNGIGVQFGKDLLEVAIACEASSDVRAIWLTGTGKMFSGGGDLKEFAGYGDQVSQKLQELLSYLNAALARLRRMAAPVVIGVNGTAAGAGMSLAVAGDYVFSSDKAKFTMAYTGVGLSPDGSASYFLPRLIGLRKTQELMLTNRVLTAAEACDWGLINEVVADDELQDASLALAKKLAQGPTKAYHSVKKLLNMTYDHGLETQLDFECQYVAAMAQTEDGRGAIQAFVEKRKPEFNGK